MDLGGLNADSWCAIGLAMPEGTKLRFRLHVGRPLSQWRLIDVTADEIGAESQIFANLSDTRCLCDSGFQWSEVRTCQWQPTGSMVHQIWTPPQQETSTKVLPPCCASKNSRLCQLAGPFPSMQARTGRFPLHPSLQIGIHRQYLRPPLKRLPDATSISKPSASSRRQSIPSCAGEKTGVRLVHDILLSDQHCR